LPSDATIGFPAETDGIILTVTGVSDYEHMREAREESRFITIHLRLSNQTDESLWVQPSDFRIMDDEGEFTEVADIIYYKHPAGERELAGYQEVRGSLLYASAKDLADLTLEYSPNSESNPISIRLVRDDKARQLHFSGDELVPLIIQDQDFDRNVRSGTYFIDNHEEADPWFPPEMEEPSVSFSQSLEYENKITSSVHIFGYASTYTVDAFYYDLAHTYSDEIADLGEKAVFKETKGYLRSTSWEVLFTRCHVVVQIHLLEKTSLFHAGEIIDYAKKLDERLTPVVCK
jgi:hypothetical protein